MISGHTRPSESASQFSFLHMSDEVSYHLSRNESYIVFIYSVDKSTLYAYKSFPDMGVHPAKGRNDIHFVTDVVEGKGGEGRVKVGITL